MFTAASRYVYGVNMKHEDNTVNIDNEDRQASGYHHGDLKAAALALGMARLAEQEHADLGLRALARELGVSATALYRHFPNKDALLDALALAALNQLGNSQAAAAQAVGGGKAGFAEVGITYVEWAVAHPALLRLIYARVGRIDLESEDPSAMSEAFRQLRLGIAAAMPDDLSQDHRTVAALHSWALVHGLAMLILDGQVEYSPQMIRNIVQATHFDFSASVPDSDGQKR